MTFLLLLIIVISWLAGQARALATTSLSFRKHTWFFDPPPFPVIRLWLHIRFNNIGCDFRIGVVWKIFQYLSCKISFSECAIDGHFYPNSWIVWDAIVLWPPGSPDRTYFDFFLGLRKENVPY